MKIKSSQVGRYVLWKERQRGREGGKAKKKWRKKKEWVVYSQIPYVATVVPELLILFHPSLCITIVYQNVSKDYPFEKLNLQRFME